MNFCCIVCILGILKTTLAPDALDPARFLMLDYLMAIWSHLLRYFPASYRRDFALPPFYFLSFSGSLDILLVSPIVS